MNLFTFIGFLTIFNPNGDNSTAEFREVAITCDYSEAHCTARVWGKAITLEQCLSSAVHAEAFGFGTVLGCSVDGREIDLDIADAMKGGI